jgi:Domain of unknown function (DUF2382)
MTLDASKENQQSSNFVHFQKVDSTSRVLSEDVISLLEERLMVNFSRHKVGEIVVRKEIETHVLQVQVPVRREKLIVEQVSPEYRRLAEVDLGQANVSDRATLFQRECANADPINDDFSSVGSRDPISVEFNQSAQPIVYGEIDSPKAASDLLHEIANLSSQDCETVRIEIVLKDSKHRDIYQALFESYS